MGFLKKLGRGIKRVAKKNRGGIGRLAKKVGPGLVLSAVTGGIGAPIIAKAASAAKTLGKKVRGLETPKSLVPVFRAAEKATKSKGSTTVMPGGLKISTPSIGMASNRAIKRRTIYDRPARVKRRGRKTTAYQTSADMKGGLTKAQNTGRTGFESAKPKKARVWSAKQIEARKRFAAAAKARRKAG